MRRAAFVALVLAAGCGPRPMRWEYALSPSLEGATMTARVRAGGCEGDDVRYERTFVDGESSGEGPRLGAGTYGVELEARNDACEVVARGCEVVSLPGGEVVRVTLEAITPIPLCAGMCVDGACEGDDAGIADAGVDAPSSDTGADAPTPTPDAGPGDECETSPDCPCGGDTCTAGVCIPARAATEVEAGEMHACAIAGGLLFCWGTSMVGEVGIDFDTSTSVPQAVLGYADWTHLSSLGRTTCGFAGGSVQCFGSNFAFQCGDFAGENCMNGPEAIGPVFDAADVSCGVFQSQAIDTDGRLYVWGGNSQRQSDPSTTDDMVRPRMVPGNWLDVASAQFFTCGVDTAHRLLCWGGAVDGPIGFDGACEPCPHEVTDPTAGAGPVWEHVELGVAHACAWDDGHHLYCWGRGDGDSRGATGSGVAGRPSQPTPVPSLLTASASLSLHSCVIDTSGALWCFGPNAFGQLGVGDRVDRLSPALVGGRWLDIGAGSDFTCGVRASGGVYCWGHGDEFKLGQEDADDHLVPTRVCMP